MVVTGYCVKCHEKGVKINNPIISKTKRGGFIAKGKCDKCKTTTVCAMMSKDNAEKAMASGEAKKGY